MNFRLRQQANGQASMEEYMMASKSVGVIPLALSLVTSFMSGKFKFRAAI